MGLNGFLLLASGLVVFHFPTTVLSDTDPIVINGSRFFYKTNGLQFFIRGVVYQGLPSPGLENTTTITDSMSDGPRCALQIPYLKNLGINTLCLYDVDPDEDHSACMSQLEAAGIYVLPHLGTTNLSLSIGYRSTSWDYKLYNRFTSLIDNLQKYPNVLGFVVAAHVERKHYFRTPAHPFVKAAVRDMKEYIRIRKYRKIPIGYIGSDDNSVSIADYLNCGDREGSVDFYGVSRNADDCKSSIYSSMTNDYRNFSAPSFFGEYGCGYPKDYSDAQEVYGNATTRVFSGGFASGWTKELTQKGETGMIDINSDRVDLRPEYYALSTQLASLNPTAARVGQSDYIPNDTVQPPCHGITIRNSGALQDLPGPWDVSPVLPPKPLEKLCSCMMQSLHCVAQPELVNYTSSAMNMDICLTNRQWCLGVRANGRSGDYGSFSPCSAIEQTSWVLNQAYLSSNGDDKACVSSGGLIQQPITTPTKDCKFLLDQAGPVGTGIITFDRERNITLTENKPKNSDLLSLQAKVGLSASLGVLFLLSISLVVFLKLRKKKQELYEIDEARKTELPDTSVSSPSINRGHEIDGNERAEMQAADTTEVDGHGIVVELPARDYEPAELEAPHGKSEIDSNREV